MTASGKLKVGAIGIGGIFQTHLNGWRSSEYTELVAGSDVNEATLKQWGKTHSITKLYASPYDLIADPDIDIVDICTPSSYHAPLTIAALQAGKHVICEKPLATKTEEIQQMIAARDQSGKLLMTAQHMRFDRGNIAAKAVVDDGKVGDVYHARAWWLRRDELPGRPGFIYKKHSGGGPCIDIGVHVLDLSLWLMGHPKPTTVTGVSRTMLAHQPGAWSVWGGKVAKDMDVEDFAAGFVRFENGASLILEVSWLMHHPTSEQRIWLYGTQGGLILPDNKLYQTSNTHELHYDTLIRSQPNTLDPHSVECVEFAKAIAQGLPSPVPAEQSLVVQSILNGLYESQATGHEVRL